MATMASSSSSSSRLLLLLLVVLLPLAATAAGTPPVRRPAPKKGGFYSPASRKAAKDQMKDYLQQQGQQSVEDNTHNNSSGGGGASGGQPKHQLGGAAADKAPALVFNLSIGTQSLSVVMDLNSDLVWALCSCNDAGASCVAAEGTPFYQPPATAAEADHSAFTAVDCGSPACQDTVTQTCAADNDTCNYVVQYTDNGESVASTKTSGYLATDTFKFGAVPVDDLLFGCSYSSTVDLSGASGSVGFNRGNLSVVSQLQLSSFSYLISSDDSKSFVAWSWEKGAPAVKPTSHSRSTPLLPPENTGSPSLYYVKLTGVEIDNQLLKIKPGTFDVQADGSGGVVLSTTDPITYLEKAAYDALRAELIRKIAAQGVKPVISDLEHLCYMTKDLATKKVPAVTLVFDGADAKMELDVKNYFFSFPADDAAGGGEAHECLTILPTVGGSVLGSLLQMDMNMTFDMDNGLLMFDKAAPVVTAKETTFGETAFVAAAPAKAFPMSLRVTTALLLLLVCMIF